MDKSLIDNHAIIDGIALRMKRYLNALNVNKSELYLDKKTLFRTKRF